MKKLTTTTLFAIAALFLFTFSGCDKNEDEIVPETEVGGSWKIGTTEYKVKFSSKTTTSAAVPKTLLIFADAAFNSPTVNTMTMSFKNAPTAAGKYQLMMYGSANADKQFELSVGSAGNAYAYLGATVDVDVTLVGGKIKVVIPEVTMKSTSGNPDAKFSATVVEQ